MAAFPNIELSQAQSGEQSLGLKGFEYQNNYAVTELDGPHSQRQTWNWLWEDITWEQGEYLRLFFLGLAGDYVVWTPFGQSQALKFIPAAGISRAAYDEFDKLSYNILMRQTNRNT